ncbi:hypothetical protein COCC4DRAFT_168963, partial [Bipolaris maydis ATCC 48331]|uniref:Uncharacterized protein n=2 Tax=Cochliobolus heterostrophus TaxID=5016 RepID=M2UMV2_COCH5
MSHHPKSWQLACAMFGALSPWPPPLKAPRCPLLDAGTLTRDVGSSYEAVGVLDSPWVAATLLGAGSASPFTCRRCRGLAAWPQRKVPSKKNSRKKRNLWTGMLARWNWMICTQHQIMEKRPTSRDVAVARPGEWHQLRRSAGGTAVTTRPCAGRGMPMPMEGRMRDVNHGEIDTRRGGLSATTHSHKHGLARPTYLVPGARC